MSESLTEFNYVMTVAIWVATIVLMIRLARANLARCYPFLFLYLLIDSLASASGILIPIRSNLYAYVYMVVQVASLAAAAGAILEMSQLALADHPALAVFSRATAGYVVLLSCVVAVATVFVDNEILPAQSVILHRFLAVERILDFAIVLFLLAISAFLMWFPIKVRRNISSYIAGFAVYFCARSGLLLVGNFLPSSGAGLISAPMLCISFTCLILWNWRLGEEGERIVTVTGHRWNPAAFEQLNRQLSYINGAVARFVRE